MEIVTQSQLEYWLDERHPVDPNLRKCAKEIERLRVVVDSFIDGGDEVLESLALAVQDAYILFDSANHVAHRK